MSKVRKNTAAIDLIDEIEPLNENFATFKDHLQSTLEKEPNLFMQGLLGLRFTSLSVDI